MPQIYNLVRQADGKYTVQKVDVFRLGECKGFNFDNSWAERMVEHMKSLKEEGYLPPVIFGHNPRDDWFPFPEMPANGFMDNFSVEFGTVPGSGVIYCDLVDINEADLPVIKDMKFPYRSVEVHPEEQYFCALALLGGTEPYHKLPRLQVNDKVVGFARDDKKKQVIAFAVTEDGLKYQERKTRAQQFKDWMRSVFMDEMDEMDGNGLDTGSESGMTKYFGAERRKLPTEVISCERRKKEYRYNPGQPEAANKPVGGKPTQNNNGGESMQKMTKDERDQFKLKYGYDPEEQKEQLDLKNAEAEQFRMQSEQNAALKIEADLKAEKVSPAAIAVIQDIIKCSRENKPAELQAKLIELVKCANDGTMIVPADDAAKEDKGTTDFSDEEKVNAAIEELRKKDPKLSFQAAYEQVRATIRGGGK